MSKIVRSDISDYLLIKSTGKFALMGAGFNTLNETVGAQVESKTYIDDKTESSTIKGYKTQFPFDTDLIVETAETEAIEELYYIGRDHKVGSDAEREYIRVELFAPAATGSTRYFKARKFKVAVEVSNFNGAGGETVTASGNLNCVGDPIIGYFDIQEKVFVEGDYTESLGILTVTSIAGAATGTTKVTVAESLTSGNVYMYKTASTVTVPSLNDDCSTYTLWNGIADITAVTGNQICIVEVNSSFLAKKTGIATVVSKA